MNKSLFSIGMATLLVSTSITTQAQGDNLIYVAVDPCRLADTRPTEGGTGALSVGSSRNFSVYGADLSGQGGDASGCLHPREASGVEPVAISAYVVAVPTASSGPGHITAYASDGAIPGNALATVNFEAGQVNGNTTNVPLCIPGATACPLDGQMAVIAFSSEQNVVIDVQGYYYPATGTCPDDMVAVGDLCVDKYEASVTNVAGDTQYGVSGADYPCSDSGSNCGADEAGSNPAIYARSLPGIPSAYITWYQALQACANVGKRLPTSAEWQAAASGTPSGDGSGCNLTTTVAASGSLSVCVSTTGAFDMIGNLWEWVGDMDNPTAPGFTSTLTSQAWAMGDGIQAQGDATTRALWIATTPDTSASRRGLRCVR